MEMGTRQKLATIVLLSIAVIGVGGAAVSSFFGNDDRGPDVRIIEPSNAMPSSAENLPLIDAGNLKSSETTADAATSQKKPEIVVHVAGRVMKPGVYNLKPGSRVNDAIKAAGGVKPDADTDSINLAARIVDGEQYFVARKGESPSVVATMASPLSSSGASGKSSASSVYPRQSASASGSSHSSSQKSSGPVVVNINKAGPEQLDRLPGVGPATSVKIIEYRKAAGGFLKPEDIMNVKGIGPKKYEDMKPYITVR